MIKITKRILKEHKEHYLTGSWDYWCVAPHPDMYSPKYLEGEYCHDGGPCNEYCRVCDRYWMCPVEGCNNEEYWDEEQYRFLTREEKEARDKSWAQEKEM